MKMQRNSPIKMVAFDLDGTILNSEKEFTKYTQNVIAKVIAKGIIVLPSTGRPISGIPREIMEFPGIRYAITANGARIIDNVQQTVLYEKLVPVEITRNILDIFEHYDTLREVYYNGVGYIQEDMLERISEFLPNSPMAQYVRSTRRTVKDIRELFEADQKCLDKVQALFKGTKDKMAALKELESIQEIEVTGALTHNIEVNAKGVHKGNALLWFGKSLGIESDEIMAIGDGANDVEMIRMAGYGIAMSNGVQAVKDVAKAIADVNDQDGAARAMLEYVLA